MKVRRLFGSLKWYPYLRIIGFTQVERVNTKKDTAGYDLRPE